MEALETGMTSFETTKTDTTRFVQVTRIKAKHSRGILMLRFRMVVV
jgi:hypothetical protein